MRRFTLTRLRRLPASLCLALTTTALAFAHDAGGERPGGTDVPGDEVLAQLRELRPDISVIAVGGYNEELAAERFGARNFEGFVPKPYEPEDLIEAVRAAVGTPGGLA